MDPLVDPHVVAFFVFNALVVVQNELSQITSWHRHPNGIVAAFLGAQSVNDLLGGWDHVADVRVNRAHSVTDLVRRPAGLHLVVRVLWTVVPQELVVVVNKGHFAKSVAQHPVELVDREQAGIQLNVVITFSGANLGSCLVQPFRVVLFQAVNRVAAVALRFKIFLQIFFRVHVLKPFWFCHLDLSFVFSNS